jgi:hypothetical protein
VIDCNGAWLRAQARGVAVRLTITGRVHAGNAHLLAADLRRFLRLGDPLIVDIQEAEPHDDWHIRLLVDFDRACAAADISWVAVVDHNTEADLKTEPATAGLPLFDSVAEGLVYFTAALRDRQRLSVLAAPRHRRNKPDAVQC